MAEEMARYYRERVQAMQTRAAEVPRELQELAAGVERLRESLKKGDPDMPDELQGRARRCSQSCTRPRIFSAVRWSGDWMAMSGQR
jgi:hypothetical protein